MKQINTELPESVLTHKQNKQFKKVVRDGRLKIKVNVRWDDNCRNGHNTFAVTVESWEKPENKGYWEEGSIGCCPELVVKYFPELAHLVKWHLVGSNQPMYYLQNTMFHASDKDHWGLRKGEPDTKHNEVFVKFRDNPILHRPGRNNAGKFMDYLMDNQSVGLDFEVLEYPHDKDPETYGSKYTYGAFGEAWYQCPFETERDALNFLYALQNCEPEFVEHVTKWGEGKTPDLEAARSCAVWPDATLEQLTDKAALTERLPRLMRRFKADVESLGMVY